MKKLKLFFIILGAFAVLGFLYGTELSDLLPPTDFFRDAARSIGADVATTTKALPELVKKSVIATEPLRGKITGANSFLTVLGVIRETNRERAVAGVASLRENTALDALAREKAADMFKRQYFEHVSPSGRGIGDLAEGRYDYILIGENLALGSFSDDADVVGAWMNSPGHRANILHPKFQEIGVGVQSGIFEGRTTWIAVQEFGMPQDACPPTDNALKELISKNESALSLLSAEAEAKKAELESMHPRTREEYNAYNLEVDAYNALAHEVNARIAETKALVTQYNDGVKAYNLCATSGDAAH